MPNIIAPSPQQPVVDQSGNMSQVMRTWTVSMTNLDIIVGSGSPENVVSAVQTRLYMDLTGSAGAILYIKRDAAISGDDKQGWILV
jgi:hypothetical protein